MRVGFTASAFDLLHAGHVAMLEEAKENCDWLIAGLQTDPTIDRPEKNKPVQTITERFIQRRACKFVDRLMFVLSVLTISEKILLVSSSVLIITLKSIIIAEAIN